MKTVRLIANRALYYDGDKTAGEEFEATEEHAAMMIRVGSAKLAAPKQKTYSRRDLRAEE